MTFPSLGELVAARHNGPVNQPNRSQLPDFEPAELADDFERRPAVVDLCNTRYTKCHVAQQLRAYPQGRAP